MVKTYSTTDNLTRETKKKLNVSSGSSSFPLHAIKPAESMYREFTWKA